MRRLRRLAGLLLAAGAVFGAVASDNPVPMATTSLDGTVRPLVFLGVGGLRWSDVEAAPRLLEVAESSAGAAMAVRTALPSACPLDGWLTLNSGARSVGPRRAGECTPVHPPQGGRIVQWPQLVEPNEDYSYDPVWGTLAEHPRTGTRCAIGPGAALALASDGGELRRAEYRGDLPRLELAGCALTVIDAGTLPEGNERTAALRSLDALVGDLARRTADQTLIVAGISDSDADSSHLTAVMVRPPQGEIDSSVHYVLRSPSTRQTGLAQLTDLTPTLLAGQAPPHLPGGRLTAKSVGASLDLPTEFDVAAQTVRSGFVPLFAVLIGSQILAWTGIWLALRRGLPRLRAARIAGLVGLWAGAVPVSSYLVNLAPWAELSHPAITLWTLVGVGSAALAGLASATGRQFGAYGPPGLVAALTLLVLAADVAGSSRLQLGSPFGLSPLVAGRFYGFGNIAFAVFAMSALLVATAAWVELREQGSPRAALLAVAVVGAFAVFVDGAPGLGTDFGGVLALAPGLAVLGLLLAGIGLSVGRLTLIAAGTVAAVSALAVADWTRPTAERTHLGEFVQDVADGRALEVIGRKAEANLGLFANPLILAVTLPLAVAAVLAVVRPELLRLHGLARVQAADPAFRALVVAALTTALLGFAVNDSGIIVPAVALFAGAPLFVAVWAHRWAAESP